MTDKVVNLTYGGTFANPTTISIDVTTNNLNEANAVYVMDVHTVFYGTGSGGYASKDIIYLERYGSFNHLAGADNIWERGTVVVNATTPSQDILSIIITCSALGSVPYRCFITAYIKDNVA